MSNRSIAVIAGLLDRHKLPWFEYPVVGRSQKRIQRFTSKTAVAMLPPARGRSPATQSVATAKPARR
jgi:hypothetical protein